MSAAQKVFLPEVEVLVYQDERLVNSKRAHRFPILIGRGEECHVRIDSSTISRKHCELALEGEKIVLRDLESHNGVRVDGQLVSSVRFREYLKFYIKRIRIEVRVLNAVKAPQKRARETVATGGEVTQLDRKSRGPVLDQEQHSQYLEMYTDIEKAPSTRLEAVLLWKSELYGVREFFQGDKITIGSHWRAALHVPNLLNGWALGRADFAETRCLIPSDRKATLIRQGLRFDVTSLGNGQTEQHRRGLVLRFTPQDVLHVDLGSDMTLVLRYIPEPASLPRKELMEPDWALKRYFLASAVIHTAIALTLWFIAPVAKNVPHLENVPERYARLLVDPPPPVLPVPPPVLPPIIEKKPEPPTQMQIVKKAAPELPKIVRRELIKVRKSIPDKRVVVKSKIKPETKVETKEQVSQVKAVRDKSLEVATSMRPANGGSKEVSKIEVSEPNLGAMGALGALGALATVSKETPAKIIKIEKGGRGIASSGSGPPMPQMAKTSGGGGALIAGGAGAIKTKPGVAGGGDYGTQGLRSKAGSRAVAGAVVGAPKLDSSTKLEGLSRKQVMDVVQKHLPEVQTCYERSLLSNADLSGRIEFEWDIQAGGNVSEVRVKSSTVRGGDALSECVKGLFRKMKFPTAKNGQSTTPNIGFPFGRM